MNSVESEARSLINLYKNGVAIDDVLTIEPRTKAHLAQFCKDNPGEPSRFILKAIHFRGKVRDRIKELLMESPVEFFEQ